MNEDTLNNIITECLKKIAPESDIFNLKPDDDIRERLNLDSFDFLQFVIALSKKTGTDIPEKDYGQIRTFKRLSDYLKEKIRD